MLGLIFNIVNFSRGFTTCWFFASWASFYTQIFFFFFFTVTLIYTGFKDKLIYLINSKGRILYAGWFRHHYITAIDKYFINEFANFLILWDTLLFKISIFRVEGKTNGVWILPIWLHSDVNLPHRVNQVIPRCCKWWVHFSEEFWWS